MLEEFFHWWLRQLQEMLPARWRASGRHFRRAVVIDCGAAANPADARCLRRRGGREVAFASFPLTSGTRPRLRRGWGTVVLRAAIMPLCCEVVLPLGAESAMHKLLQAEMDRLTPFVAEEVFWNATIRRRDGAQGRLHATLMLLPRSALAPVLTALERLGVVPDVLEGVQPDGAVHHLALHPPRRRWLPLIAGAAAILLLAGGLAVPFVAQQRQEAELQQRISRLQPLVVRAQALRQRMAGRQVDASAVAAELHRLGDPMQVIATLTRLLPDDTWITELTMRERRLSISGHSAAAARLIGTLAAGALIRNPLFVAPVVRDASGQTDAFSLSAEVAP